MENTPHIPDVKVTIHDMPLSDSSRVYAVSIVDPAGGRVILDCISERHALSLHSVINAAINLHTNLTA